MKKVTKSSGSPALMDEISHKYIPYWPLLALLAVPCILLAWVFLKFKEPIYEITAKIEVKDAKKGVNEDQITESLNMLSSKSIVENEVEVLHSMKFVDEVVRDLRLYAPVFQEGGVKAVSAYLTSPVKVEAENPDGVLETKKVYYQYDFNKKLVSIDNKAYPINQVVSTPYGRLKFVQNEHFKKSSPGKLYFSLIQPAKVTSGLFAGLDVSAVGKLSSIIKVKYKDAVPQRGKDIVNAVIEKYNAAKVENKTDLAKNTMAFLDQRIAKVVSDLNGVEQRIENYRSSRGVVNLTDQSRLYLQNVAMNDQKLADINMQLSVLEQVEKYVTSRESTAGIIPSTLGVNDLLLSKLLERLYDAELQYEKLKQTTAENNPALQTIAGQVQTLRPTILENVRNQRINLNAGKSNLMLTNSTYNAALGTIPEKERELLDVSREQSTKNSLYSFLLQKREQAALSYSSSIDEIQVIDKAESSVLPVSPNKMFIYGGALGLAILLTVAYIIYRDILSNKVLFRSDIQKLSQHPLLGEISYVRKGKERLLTGRDFVNAQDEFRQLAAAGGFFNKDNPNKKLLVTSSIKGEGKTLIAANIALTLSQAGKRVALLDMDIRNAQLSRTFKVVNHPGLSEYLVGDINHPSEIVRPSGYKHLSVLGAGENVSVSAEMFLDGRLESLMEYLEHNFDFIIMDTAPVNPAADAYILSEFCDLTLYVVRHRKTPKSFLRKLDETNEMKPLKRLCLVFNGIKPRGFIIKTKGYGYGSKHVPHNYRLLSKLTLRNKNGVAKKTYTPVKQL